MGSFELSINQIPICYCAGYPVILVIRLGKTRKESLWEIIESDQDVDRIFVVQPFVVSSKLLTLCYGPVVSYRSCELYGHKRKTPQIWENWGRNNQYVRNNNKVSKVSSTQSRLGNCIVFVSVFNINGGCFRQSTTSQNIKVGDGTAILLEKWRGGRKVLPG